MFWSNGCSMQVPDVANAGIPAQESWLRTLVITHPSGARGEFKTRIFYHGTNRAPGGCGMFGNVETAVRFGTWGVPSVNGVVSIHSKKISGPGLSDRAWTYGYEPSWSFQSQCSNDGSRAVFLPRELGELMAGESQRPLFASAKRCDKRGALSVRRSGRKDWPR
jgi:hypothetical protein